MRFVTYGGTMSGIAAAIAAARAGVSVDLIEPTAKLGTMWATGLGQTDREGNPAVGGHVRCGILSEMETRFGQIAGSSSGFLFPTMDSVNQVIGEFLDAVADKVTVRTGAALEAVDKDGTTGVINSVRCGGVTYPARNFTDATDEADLAAMAGCLMRRGREGQRVTGEPTAGVRAPTVSNALAYDPATGERLVGVHPAPAEAPGTGDRRLMAYNMRIIVTKHDSRIRWADIDVDYDPEDYRSDLNLAIAHNYTTIPMSIGRTDDGLLPVVGGIMTHDANNGGLVRIGTNWIGQFNDWPDLTWAQREARKVEYVRRTLGLFKTICTDAEWLEQRPALVADTKLWGLVPGQFPDSVCPGMSPSMYVREARRAVCQRERRLEDLFGPDRNPYPEPVMVGGYPHADGHWANRYAMADGRIGFEGGSGLDAGKDIVLVQYDWGMFKPPVGHARNLTVSRGISGTRLGWITHRIELPYIKAGQVTGIAGGVAEVAGKYTGDIDYKSELLPALEAAGMILKIPGVA